MLQGHRGPPLDVWSLGVTYFYMLTKSFPFEQKGEDIMEYLERIRYEEVWQRFEIQMA
jgi:serine/threonine protein kinase